MAKYIDAELLRKESKMVYITSNFTGVEGYTQEQIDNAPTAEVKEVVRGKWEIQNKSKFNYDKCSACGFNKPSFLEFRKYDFCPHCGVDMREDVE